MMTVHEVSRISGVSIRTLQYYDRIGLLPPVRVTEAKYRLYDESSLEKLQQILLFKELEFPLREIRRILSSPDFDRDKALAQQTELLRLKKEHIEKLIELAADIREKRNEAMSNFEAFDTKQMDEYAAQAKAAWGQTDAYREYERKAGGRSREEEKSLADRMMGIFAEFGGIRGADPASAEAQALVRKLRDFITAHYYTCTGEILGGLGRAYAAGGEFTRNIDKAGGDGTAAFAAAAIEAFREAEGN